MAKKNVTFEEAIMLLEDSVSKLESGALALDEAISEFEKAVGLVKLCEEKLSSAKQRVRILTEDDDGAITDAPFVKDNDEA